MMYWNTTGALAISVAHDSHMEGGGTWFGQDYITEIKRRYPERRFRHCLEWCSGPGFIGYNLLSHGLIEHLSLQDSYAPAVACAQQTANQHALSMVTCYACDTVAALPKHVKFDLVVANPPHYLECPGDANYQRLAVDQNWSAHQEFYQSIGSNLEPDGVVLMQENQAGSIQGVEDFRSMIESNGLEISDVSRSLKFWYQPGPWAQIYYIEIRQKK